MHARARKWGTRSTAASNRLSYRVIIVDPRTRDTRYYVLYVYTDYYSYVSNNYKGTRFKHENTKFRKEEKRNERGCLPVSNFISASPISRRRGYPASSDSRCNGSRCNVAGH